MFPHLAHPDGHDLYMIPKQGKGYFFGITLINIPAWHRGVGLMVQPFRIDFL